MYCGNCGFQMNEGSEFCPNCGFKNDFSKPVCPKCSHEVKGSFCGICGYNLVGTNNINDDNDHSVLYIILGSIGFLLVFLGCLAPFATAHALFLSDSINYISGDGVIIVIISLVGFILLLLKQGWISFALSIISLILTLIDATNVSTSSFEYEFVSVNLDYGFYLIVIGLVLAMIMSILVSVKKHD